MDVTEVFRLIDMNNRGVISQAALAQALLSTSLLEEAQCRELAAEPEQNGQPLDEAAFHRALSSAVQAAGRAQLESTHSCFHSYYWLYQVPWTLPTFVAGTHRAR